jgi:PD-(D/E)XK nuclease superfamily
MTDTRPIINIDSSSLSQSSCILNWYRTAVLGYREKVSGVSLVYGSAVHKFIDTMYQTNCNLAKARTAAFEVFEKPKFSTSSNAHLMDKNHLLITCFNVWEESIVKDKSYEVVAIDGKPCTEMTFSFPYYEDDAIVVNLCGTIDTIGKIHNGCYCIRDFKTTSRFNHKEYLADYKMSKQLRFYTLAMKLMAERYPDSALGKIGATDIGCRIDAIFLNKKASDNQYLSSDVYIFKKETMDEFRSVLDGMLKKLSHHVKRNSFPREGIVNDTCKTTYKCKFWNVCGAPIEFQDIMLKRDFQQVNYNPLAFGEVL